MPLDQLTQTMPQAGKKLNKKATAGKKDEILINPKDDDRPIQESTESTAVMTFGRFNPPTVGHEKLIHKVQSVAQEHKGSAHVFASHSEGTSKDPLPQKHKIGYLKKVAPEGTTVHGSSKAEPTFLHAAKKLSDAGHKHLVMVAGSDRVKEYEDRLNKYNGKEGHHNFKSIKVVSSGERDPDAEGVEGMSGTKMRAHARAGEHEKFKAGLPKALHPHANEIMNHIKSIKEDVNDEFRTFVEQLTSNKEKNQKQRSTRLSYIDKMNAGNHETHKGIHDSVSYNQFAAIMDIVEGVEISESDITSLKFKAYRSNVPFETLKEVYSRGISDWSNIDYTTQTPQQWAFARVNSFVSGGKATEMDADLYEALKDACWKGYKAIGMKKKNGKDVPNCVPEETELDEVSADLIGKYSEKASKEYNDPKISAQKKATRRAGLMLGYNKVKARANVPATYKEEAKLNEMDKSQEAPGRGNQNDYSKGKWSEAKPIKSKEAVKNLSDKLSKALSKFTKEEADLDEAKTPAWQRKEGKNPEGGLNKKGIASYRSRNPGSKLSTAVTTKPSKLKAGSKAANRRKSFCARMGGMKKRLTSAETARDPDSRINKALRKWNC